MSKILDHRTSKTYDIKPVDKRGNLDEEKLREGEDLVQLRDLEREGKSAQMLKKFEEEKERVSQDRLIFDIGIKAEALEVETQGQEERLIENQIAEDQIDQKEKEKEDISVFESPQPQIEREEDGIENVDGFEVAEDESPEDVLKKFKETFEEKDQSEEVLSDIQIQEEVSIPKRTIEEVRFEESEEREVEETETGLVSEEVLQNEVEHENYVIFEGNRAFTPEERPEIKVLKIQISGLQKFEKKQEQEQEQELNGQLKEERSLDCKLEKTRKRQENAELLDQWMSEDKKEQEGIVEEQRLISEESQARAILIEQNRKDAEERKEAKREREEKLELEKQEKAQERAILIERNRKDAEERKEAKREQEERLELEKQERAQERAILIEQNRKDAEERKEAKREREERLELAKQERAQENRLFWERKLEEKKKELEEEDKIEKAIREKSEYNEPIIENKLNSWFDGGEMETPVVENKNLKALKTKGKEQETLVSDSKTEKQEKEESKFIENIFDDEKKQAPEKKKGFFSLNYRKSGDSFGWSKLVAKPMLSFVATSFVAFLMVGSIVFVSYGFQVQENVKVKGRQALGHLDKAKDQLRGQDFLSAKTSFASAVEEFESAQKELDRIGGDMLNVFSTLPILSRLSSGKNVVDAGNELTKAAKELSSAIEVLSELKNPFSFEEEGSESQQSMLDMFKVMQEKLSVAEESLTKAEKDLSLVDIEDLPSEYQDKFRKIKGTLPMVLSMIRTFEQNSEIFLELLGHNGPRKYLLLFQNNQEMRATGGFIGSYGILHISNGKIKKLLIEGIYNPDGQLKYDVVPPLPIQKISASWSTHDSNWFPHFPTTAEKVAMFYEYTGGPTVDGIITMTPTVLQRMLEITGPIEMEDYNTTVNTENFIEATQYEVEVDYDKTENKPKQFLADLAPRIITSLFEARDVGDASMTLEMFSDMLKERHIMLYSMNNDVQSAIAGQGWSGGILKTEKDYLMVINSNINGFKTDGVIDETITHNSKIAEDGTITNTVKIKRVHNGGDTDYAWWNKVNSNYMRVYVPKGSKLLSVKGQTREINEPPIDYDKLGFKRDKDVVREENSIELDEETGTRIYEEEGKTVFANWVYVSPKETVQVEYTYQLPFKIDTHKNEQVSDTYSLLVQKQSGSLGSNFSSKVEYESKINPIWMYPQNIGRDENVLDVKAKLTTDLFFGTVFQAESATKDN
ncbi:DUF4012 domain-containing protein [bacterium]|jgi:hypothetical protein|nr:DUF4012 domain-containing protein [bacterium]MBT4251097.1 DUF4012 domain-containing protein [bacterium]MBT4598111.1 DUF4012 domain-containing protein [bacterium]MBT6753453.1 DUF4012 domain-containing protein [bacterium]MBT7038166.1 DUF4012 domain-containing protein [bacterium]